MAHTALLFMSYSNFFKSTTSWWHISNGLFSAHFSNIFFLLCCCNLHVHVDSTSGYTPKLISSSDTCCLTQTVFHAFVRLQKSSLVRPWPTMPLDVELLFCIPKVNFQEKKILNRWRGDLVVIKGQVGVFYKSIFV